MAFKVRCDRPLSPEFMDLLRPWAALVNGMEVRTAGAGVWLARALSVQAVTWSRVASVRPELWGAEDVGLAALFVHEAVHIQQQRESGWWRFLARYLWWRVRHPLQAISQHPLERPAYAKADEVGDHWREARPGE
jgi:hypothetical protein